LFSDKIPEELNSDYVLTVFIPYAYLYGTMQGPTLRVPEF